MVIETIIKDLQPRRVGNPNRLVRLSLTATNSNCMPVVVAHFCLENRNLIRAICAAIDWLGGLRAVTFHSLSAMAAHVIHTIIDTCVISLHNMRHAKGRIEISYVKKGLFLFPCSSTF